MKARTSVLVAACCLVAAVVLPATASAHGTHLKAKMSGDQVVGAAGAPNGTGRANLHVLKNKSQLCYEVQWNHVGNKTGLNIGVYTGAAGKNGTEVVALDTQQGSSPVESCVENVSAKTLKDLNKSPHLFHVTLKNKKFPKDGAVRGQLKAV